MKKMLLFATLIVLSLTTVPMPKLCAQDHGLPRMPGRIEGTGTHFEVTDSEYLNITLNSTEPIKLILESVPQMVTMHLEAAEAATSTEITVSGFPPSTTFYKYEDDYHNGLAITSDESGIYSYVQDLLSPHLVFIQTNHGTRFIPSDTEIGTWDAGTRAYTLTTDVYETIQVDQDNLTLDGGGMNMIGSGPGSGSGVYLFGRTGVTLKNLNVQNFNTGIYLYGSTRNCVADNAVCGNSQGILAYSCFDNVLADNVVADNYYGILVQNWCENNTLTGNSAESNDAGIWLYNACDGNTLTGNAVKNNAWGIIVDNCFTNTLTENTVTGNTYGVDFEVWPGYWTIFTGNTLSYNCWAVFSVFGADYLKVYNNNFIYNTHNANGIYSGIHVLFNLDRPVGGNYWTDWTGPDGDGDGFVDQPYAIASGLIDNLPLAQPATDADSDGVYGHVEDAAPNGGDGNKDGILDSEQENVASLPNAEDGSHVTLESPEGTQLVDVIATGNPSPDDAPPDVAFPVGFFQFRVQGLTPGGSTTVTLYLPQKVDTFYKYGPEPDNPTDHWFEFLYDGATGAKILGDKVVLYLVDGQRGDYDLQANGEIVEPGAVAIYPRTWLGFLPPLEPEGKHLFKRGSTIPVKFRIGDHQGMPVADAYATLAVYYLGDGAPAGEPEVESTAAGDWGDQFRYSPEDDLYIFNLSTKDPAYIDWFTYELVVTLDDGQTYEVNFSLK